MRLVRKSWDKKDTNGSRGYLDGQMLIAMPAMRDERFARSVIYVCAHSSEGAMGIIVNHPLDLTLDVLFEKVGRHPGQVVGKSPYLQPVQVMASPSLIGTIASVRIDDTGSYSLFGTLAAESAAQLPQDAPLAAMGA